MGISLTSYMHSPTQQFLSLRTLGAPAVVVSLALQGVFRGFKDIKTPVLHLDGTNKNMDLITHHLVLTSDIADFPKYARTGCNDTCGNVRIPFPFGIGAKCSLNEWYNVDCDSSTPYLSSLNHLEVLDVDLGYQTVTVKMHKFFNCSQTSESVDLGSSPFLYSKSYNTFVYEGYCGNAVMMDNHGGVLTGCSTICINDTKYNTTGIIDTSNCFGISCCQTKISQYLESYSMNLTSIERQKDGDDVCGSAYLLDKNSHQSARDGTSYIPTSLEWFLSDHDREQVSCSSDWEKGVMDLGNGTMMDSWSCYGGSGIKGNPYLIDGYGT
ncbi:wall-associated kinase family protein [Tanacetum coccineum]